MAKPILMTVFNHKGGIGKTTAVFNIAYILSHDQGKRVLMVDADPQSSLTALVFPRTFRDPNEQQEFYQKYARQREEGKYTVMSDIFYPAIKGEAATLPSIDRARDVRIAPVSEGDDHFEGLYIIPGSLDVGLLDKPTELGLSGLEFYRGMPGIFTDMFREIAKLNEIDIVIFDLNPNICGAMNRSLIMGSDYFCVPFFPDFLSQQAIQNLLYQIPVRWRRDFRDIIPTTPLFLGAFPHKIRTRASSGATYEIKLESAYKVWIEKIYQSVRAFEQKLSENDMIVENFLHKDSIGVRDFTSVGLYVQESGHPISDLSFPHHNAGRVISQSDKDRKKWSKDAYRKIIGVLIRNLKAEDRDQLFPVYNADGQRNANGVDIRSWSQLYDGWDPREMEAKPTLPREMVMPSPLPAGAISPYTEENVRVLLSQYFKDDDSVVILGPLAYGKGMLEIKRFREELSAGIVGLFGEDKLEDHIIVIAPIRMLSRDGLSLLVFDSTREESDSISVIVYYYDPLNGDPEKIDEEVEIVFADLKINIKHINKMQEDRGDARDNPGLWIVEEARQLAAPRRFDSIFDMEACSFEHRGMLKYQVDLGLQLPPQEKRADKRYFFEIIGQQINTDELIRRVLDELQRSQEYYQANAILNAEQTWANYLEKLGNGQQPIDKAVVLALKQISSIPVVVIDAALNIVDPTTHSEEAAALFICRNDCGYYEALLIKEKCSVQDVLTRLKVRRSERIRDREGSMELGAVNAEIRVISPRKRRRVARTDKQFPSIPKVEWRKKEYSSLLHAIAPYHGLSGQPFSASNPDAPKRNSLPEKILRQLQSSPGLFIDCFTGDYEALKKYCAELKNGGRLTDQHDLEILMRVLDHPILVIVPNAARAKVANPDVFKTHPIGQVTIIGHDCELNCYVTAVRRYSVGEASQIAYAVEHGLEFTLEENRSPVHRGLSFQRLPKDGHCLYRAISLYLQRGESIQFLRNMIADNLTQNPQLYAFIPLPANHTIQEYIHNIRTTNEWAGDLELDVLMRILNRPIVVVGPEGKVRNYEAAQQYHDRGDPIFVYYDNVSHYDALLLNGKVSAQEIFGDLSLPQPQSSALTQINQRVPTSSYPVFFGQGRQPSPLLDEDDSPSDASDSVLKDNFAPVTPDV